MVVDGVLYSGLATGLRTMDCMLTCAAEKAAKSTGVIVKKCMLSVDNKVKVVLPCLCVLEEVLELVVTKV